MREERIMVRPFEDLQVTDFWSIQEVNAHARAEIRGMIPYDRRGAYADAGRKLLWIQVVAVSQKKEETLFYGVADHLKLQVEGGVCMTTISLTSGTRLMDLEEHIRSFQSEEFTYKELLDVCCEAYEDGDKIMMTGKGRHIPHFIMQYKETDWAFIKRLASMEHTVVFADCSTKGVRFHFGIPDRKAGDEEIQDHQIQYDIEGYWDQKENGSKLRPEDTMSYIWKSREIHRIGEAKDMDGSTFVIWKIETTLKGNELYHTCYMKPRAGLQVPVQQDFHLAGVSLSATVKSVVNDRVQILIDSDEYKDKNRSCWFAFSTIYSSGDGTGWYCMPEVGDIVRLYFPTIKERDAYVISAYHEEGTALRTRPERKSWRNKEGKEIQLSPGYILMTNNDGTYIELSDEEGIQMATDGSISIYANGSLNLSAGAAIELSAPQEIILKQGNTRMDLGGDIVMQGAKVML